MTTPRRPIYVAGAVTYDYLIYPMTLTDTSTNRGDRSDSTTSGKTSQLVIRTAGADLVAQLLGSIAPQWSFQVLAPRLQQPASNSLKPNASSVIDLSRNESSSEEGQGFAVAQVRQIDKRPVWHAPPFENIAASGASTVVISGSGDAYQDVEPALDFLQRVRPKYIIHHMTRPLAVGRLWDIIRNGPMVTEGVPDLDHLAVILDAEDLRAEGIPLSRSLSWESTAEDFVRNLGSNGRLDTLVTCPNLIVRFGNEGVIHHRGRDAVNPKLYFNPRKMESPNDHMVGLTSAFTAGFAAGFPDSEKGIRLGISVANRLSSAGFQCNNEDRAPDYPSTEVMENLSPEKGYTAVSVPSTNISSGDSFYIFDTLAGDVSELARKIVTDGPDKALGRCSVKKIGDLQSVDRTEQESLGAIVHTIHERLTSQTTTEPTCIGLLGPPGSGKRFAANNIANHVTESWPIRRITYDARVMHSADLVNMCQTMRDNSAQNILTIACFENFEHLLIANSTVVHEFFTLMRDGTFSDNGTRRKVGQCLLFFLVNEEAQSNELAPTPTASEFRESRFRRADDSEILDKLHGAIHLRGPNQVGSQDKLYSVRRALMLRQLLKERHPHLFINARVKIDDAVLHALLFGPAYKHGVRSLDKIISTSRLSGRTKFDIPALPPEEQIQLHVDGPKFMSALRSPKLPPALREKLAERLFETYKKQRVLMAKTDQEKADLESDRSMVDWDELSGELKESTRSQADDIPRKLRSIGCFMLSVYDPATPTSSHDDSPFVHVPHFSSEDLDMLSEMEHERFNAERLQRQWRMGSRNSKQRTTPFIKPWRDLEQEWRDVDRVMVECVPATLAEAGWRIYRMREGDE